MMEFIHIHNANPDIQLSNNFWMSEFYSKLKFSPNIEFDMPKPLLDGIQFISDYWKPKGGIRPTSVCRPYPNQAFHKDGKAMDFVTWINPLYYINEWNKECRDHRTSPLIQGLRKIGITGFGVEGGCTHFDVGNRAHSDLYPKDSYGEYCVFTWRPASTEREKILYPKGISRLIP